MQLKRIASSGFTERFVCTGSSTLSTDVSKVIWIGNGSLSTDPPRFLDQGPQRVCMQAITRALTTFSSHPSPPTFSQESSGYHLFQDQEGQDCSPFFAIARALKKECDRLGIFPKNLQVDSLFYALQTDSPLPHAVQCVRELLGGCIRALTMVSADLPMRGDRSKKADQKVLAYLAHLLRAEQASESNAYEGLDILKCLNLTLSDLAKFGVSEQMASELLKKINKVDLMTVQSACKQNGVKDIKGASPPVFTKGSTYYHALANTASFFGAGAIKVVNGTARSIWNVGRTVVSWCKPKPKPEVGSEPLQSPQQCSGQKIARDVGVFAKAVYEIRSGNQDTREFQELVEYKTIFESAWFNLLKLWALTASTLDAEAAKCLLDVIKACLPEEVAECMKLIPGLSTDELINCAERFAAINHESKAKYNECVARVSPTLCEITPNQNRAALVPGGVGYGVLVYAITTLYPVVHEKFPEFKQWAAEKVGMELDLPKELSWVSEHSFVQVESDNAVQAKKINEAVRTVLSSLGDRSWWHTLASPIHFLKEVIPFFGKNFDHAVETIEKAILSGQLHHTYVMQLIQVLGQAHLHPYAYSATATNALSRIAAFALTKCASEESKGFLEDEHLEHSLTEIKEVEKRVRASRKSGDFSVIQGISDEQYAAKMADVARLSIHHLGQHLEHYQHRVLESGSQQFFKQGIVKLELSNYLHAARVYFEATGNTGKFNLGLVSSITHGLHKLLSPLLFFVGATTLPGIKQVMTLLEKIPYVSALFKYYFLRLFETSQK